MFQLLINAVCLMLPIVCYGEPVQYRDCGPSGALKGVDITPCSSNPCALKKGTNATVTINFQPTISTPTLKAKVYGIFVAPVEFPLPKPDGCKDCNVQCPVSAGTAYTYINTFPVLTSYPTIRLPVKWELTNGQNDLVVCFVFPLSIEA